jgi:hypothetical protein
MTPILPFLSKEIPSLKWKIDKKKSALENLQDALSQFSKLKEVLDKNELPPKTHALTQKKLLKSLEETNMNLLSVKMLQLTLSKRKFSTLNKKLQEATLPTISSSLLSLYAKSRSVRNQAANYEAASKEIESEYFAQLSLYQMEIDRQTCDAPKNP